jgi:hypothetical protein
MEDPAKRLIRKGKWTVDYSVYAARDGRLPLKVVRTGTKGA